jgi:cbb3-type cytochrome oxidase maturation protein
VLIAAVLMPLSSGIVICGAYRVEQFVRRGGLVMNAVAFLLPLMVLLGAVFAVMFFVAAAKGQFDDLDDPPQRILKD